MEAQVKFSPRKRVLNHLREGIANGIYPVGQPLPSERDLAQSVGVARMTVRSVLLALDEQGIVHSNGGRLRLVSEQAEPIQEVGAVQVLKNTLVLVSINPEGSASHHKEHGWSDRIDHGVLIEARKHRLHHLTFEPSRLIGNDWEHLLAAQPHGVIITDLLDEGGDALQRAVTWRERGLAVVAYGNAPDSQELDRVSSDHEAGGYLLTQALLEMGRKSIVMIAPAEAGIYWFDERYAGYCRAHQERGLVPSNPVPVSTMPSVENLKQGFELKYRLLAGYLAPLFSSSKVDAIIALSDGQVAPLSAACRALGKAPNKDIVIAGYDDFWSETLERTMDNEAPMFSIDKRNGVIGAELVRLLEERVSGQLPPAAQKRLVKPVLRRRVR